MTNVTDMIKNVYWFFI